MTSNDDEAFVAFVRARGRALARTATLIAGDPVAGEDLLQTALAQTCARWNASGTSSTSSSTSGSCWSGPRSAYVKLADG